MASIVRRKITGAGTPADLLQGELFVNEAEGVLYYGSGTKSGIWATAPIALTGGAAAASTLTGSTLASNVVNSSLTSVGTLASPNLGTPSSLIGTNISGTGGSFTAGAATQLSTARTISLAGEASGNTNFDGSGNVTITTLIPLLDGGNY